MLHTHIHIYGI